LLARLYWVAVVQVARRAFTALSGPTDASGAQTREISSSAGRRAPAFPMKKFGRVLTDFSALRTIWLLDIRNMRRSCDQGCWGSSHPGGHVLEAILQVHAQIWAEACTSGGLGLRS